MRTLHLDVPEKDLKGLELGEKVTITVSGAIRSVSLPYEYEDEDGKKKKDETGDLSIKINDFKIDQDNGNVFEKIAEEEDS